MGLGSIFRKSDGNKPKDGWAGPSNDGYCTVCEREATFVITGEYLRNTYFCTRCKSLPRNRALIYAMNLFARDWKQMELHESSPSGPASAFIKRNCKSYSSSHYYPDVPRGQYKGEHRSEDLSQLTFDDNTFDLLVTSDVFEHIYEPEKAFSEVARVLKPGGLHIFTMPWYSFLQRTRKRAELQKDGTVKHIMDPEYHGNPIDHSGSLVTYDWGLDFVDIIYRSSGMTTTIYLVKDRSLGLDGDFLEVFISRKPEQP